VGVGHLGGVRYMYMPNDSGGYLQSVNHFKILVVYTLT